MRALELRNDLIQYIDKADVRLLKVVKAVMESYWEEEIVAYTVGGKALNKESYQNELNEGIEEIKRVDFITQQDLEKESENW